MLSDYWKLIDICLLIRLKNYQWSFLKHNIFYRVKEIMFFLKKVKVVGVGTYLSAVPCTDRTHSCDATSLSQSEAAQLL